MKSLKKELCLRCEAKGVETKAETYVKIDGLLNEEYHPLCKECRTEWEKEYDTLDLDSNWRDI